MKKEILNSGKYFDQQFIRCSYALTNCLVNSVMPRTNSFTHSSATSNKHAYLSGCTSLLTANRRVLRFRTRETWNFTQFVVATLYYAVASV
jgi:hypothetical protein